MGFSLGYLPPEFHPKGGSTCSPSRLRLEGSYGQDEGGDAAAEAAAEEEGAVSFFLRRCLYNSPKDGQYFIYS